MDYMLLWLCTEAIVSLKLNIVKSDWLGNSLPIYSVYYLSKLYSLPCPLHGHVHYVYVPGPWCKL